MGTVTVTMICILIAIGVVVIGKDDIHPFSVGSIAVCSIWSSRIPIGIIVGIICKVVLGLKVR